MEKDNLKELLFGDNVKFDYDLKKTGLILVEDQKFFKAEYLKDLVNFLKKLKKQRKIFILGAGSNTLISDGLINGVVIKLSKEF